MAIIKMMVLLLALAAGASGQSLAAGRHGGGSGGAHASVVGHYSHGSRSVPGVQRDRHGRIARSREAKTAFKQKHPCPSTGRSTGMCPGYVVDHTVALKRGGADAPRNMQWQRVSDAKAKDRNE